MVIVAQVSFSRQYLNQAVAVYTGLPALPPGIKLSGPFFRPEAEVVHAVSIYHLASVCEEEGLASILKRYKGFQEIPGFSKEIREWHEYREMLAAWFN